MQDHRSERRWRSLVRLAARVGPGWPCRSAERRRLRPRQPPRTARARRCRSRTYSPPPASLLRRATASAAHTAENATARCFSGAVSGQRALGGCGRAQPDAAVVGAGGWPDREAARWRLGRSRRRYCLPHDVLPASRPCLPQQVLGAVQQLRGGYTMSRLAVVIGSCHAVDGMVPFCCWGGLGAEWCRQPLFRAC